MEAIKYYIEQIKNNGATLKEARNNIYMDALNEITEIISDYDDDSLIEMMEDDDVLEDVHRMEDFDDVFDYMTPSEVLEELTDIDLCDEWFNSDTKQSSNLILDLIDINYRDIADMIIDGYFGIEDDEITVIIDEMNEAYEAVEQYFKKYELAKTLFEKAMSENIDEVISVLWNMNA